MLTTEKETNYPVAIINPYGDGEERTVYYSEDYKAPPLAKVRKLLEMYNLPQPEYGNEIECDYPYEDITPLFRPNERITMFIAGCQNCGKYIYKLCGNSANSPHTARIHPAYSPLNPAGYDVITSITQFGNE